MQTFIYRGINSAGIEIKGRLNAENLRAAIRLLQKQGLTPVNIEPAVGAPAKQPGLFQGRLKKQDILIALEQLHVLLASGISLEESLASISASPSHPQLESALAKLERAIKSGNTFSTALKDSNLPVPPYFHALTEAGELTGQLAEALEDGLQQWHYETEVAGSFKSALIYPAILVTTGLGAIILIFMVVVPKFATLLTKNDTEIPFLAQCVLRTGMFFHDNSLAIACFAILTFSAVCYSLAHPEMRRRMLDHLSHLPSAGDWLISGEITRWASLLSVMLANRIALVKALELARRYLKLTTLRGQMSQVEKSVRNGNGLAESLREVGALSPSGYNLIEAGEKSGRLPEMLRVLARLYEKEMRNRTRNFLTLLEPVAILLIGLVIGVIMAGIILAITSANNIAL